MSNSASSSLRRWPQEIWWALLFASFLVGLHLFTAEWTPIEVNDEVLLSEAGLNLVQGYGFTSRAWPGQGEAELFSGNFPLYPLVLAGWFKLWGFSFVAWRGFTYCCLGGAALFFWWGVRRMGWLRSGWAAAFGMALFFGCGAGFYPFRIARYDGLQLLLWSSVLLAWGIPQKNLRLALIFIVGALLGTSGLQSGLYGGLLSLLALAYLGRAALLPAFCLCAGLTFGAAGVLGFWWSQGTLAGFKANVAWTHEIERSPHGPLYDAWMRLVIEPMKSLYFPVLAMAFVWGTGAKRAWRAWLPLLGALLIGVAFHVLVHFRTHYQWTAALPLAFGTAAAFERREISRHWRRGWAIAVLGLLCLAGPIKTIFLGWLLQFQQERAALAEMVRREVRPDDIIVSEFAGFSTLRLAGQRPYLPPYMPQLSEKASQDVSVLLRRPAGDGIVNGKPIPTPFDRFAPYSSEWVQTGFPASPAPRPLLRWLQQQFPSAVKNYLQRNDGYRLGFYRRAGSRVPSPDPQHP